ncbi:MAG: glycosyltransferase family 4 protein [Steroidobacteraceae bacterium]
MLIDATRLTWRALCGRMPTGIERVSLAYVARYQHEAQALLVWQCCAFLLPPGASRRLWRLLLAPPGGRSRRAIALVVLWGALAGAATFHRVRGHILLNTGHFGLEGRLYRLVLRHHRFRPVFFVHDLIPITHPEYVPPGDGDRHAIRIRTALERGVALIANSRATLAELTAHAAEIRVAIPAAVTAPLASGLKRAAPGARPLAGPYFVILGNIEARKNHLLLLQVWRQLVERFGSAAPKLVIIGKRGWECENVLDLLDRCDPLRGFVIEHSNCADPELQDYLHHAQALLYPSFAEGYGMPVIESLSFGVPVVVSDLPVFREVGGEVPEYIDPLDGKRWAEVVTEFARPDSPLRAAQLERLSRFREPTWPEHFAIVDELLGRLHGSVGTTGELIDGRVQVGDGVGVR